ncbi:MAG: hypothetical protein ACLTAI_12325 [Thomasclavelia sp.]
MENVGLDYFIFKQDIEENKITKNTIDGEQSNLLQNVGKNRIGCKRSK